MKTYSVDELKEILRLHKMWINSEPGGVRANLSGANLSGASLYGADLYGADLSSADLAGANLYGASLYGAYLSGANLYGANLSRANLKDTILEGKSLISFQFEKHMATFYGDRIRIGCHELAVSEWLERYKEIGEKEGYNEKQIEEYGAFIKYCYDRTPK